jgi:hypothetical protein
MEAVIEHTEAVINHRVGAPYHSSAEVLRLMREFEACSLPRGRWTHHAHLVVALCYLVRHGEAKATALIRDGIRRYNEACGIKTTRSSGYHETITLFYIRVIRKFLSDANRDCTLAALANALISACGDKNLPLEYYSRERLLSWEARTTWLEPDLKAFD